jgi:hypothetical protein
MAKIPYKGKMPFDVLELVALLLHFSNSFKLSMEQHNVLVSAHTTQCGWQRHCLAGEGSTSWLPAVRD